MSSSEHLSRPHIVFAPDHTSGGITTARQLEPQQSAPRTETSSTTNQYPAALIPQALARLGFPLEQIPTDLENSQSLLPRQSVMMDVAQSRAARREQFEQAEDILMITDGSKSKVLIAPEEMLSLYKSGISVQELAYRFRVSHRTIYKYLHRGGIDEFWAEERQKQEDEHRRERAKGLCLDENSTWLEIFAFLDQQQEKLEETHIR